MTREDGLFGLAQLSARGPEDKFITTPGAPPDEPFRQVCRRHTHTTRSPLHYTTGGPGSSRASARVVPWRHSYILRNATLEITMTREEDAASPPFPAEAYIRSVSVSVSGRQIDAFTGGGGTSGGGGWLRMYDELFGGSGAAATFAPGQKTKTFYVPLPLWFRDGNRPLVLTLLAYSDVEFFFEFRRVHGLTVVKADLLVEYTECSADDVRSMQRVQRDQVIEHMQTLCVRANGGPDPTTVDLRQLLGPTRFLALDVRAPSGGPSDLNRLALCINGRVYLDEAGSYFNEFEPRRRVGRTLSRGKYLVPFCTQPGELRHSTGSLNFSSITPHLLLYTDRPCIVDVFACSYNVFRYSSGMAGLGFLREQLVLDTAHDAFPEAVAVQAAWRGHAARLKYMERLHEHYAPDGPGGVATVRRLYESAG